MNKLNEVLTQPEGRRLEFKETIPSKADLAKAIIAFANDAGGDFYLGIKDMPREITGLNEDELIVLEEKISNIIHDQWLPVIHPETSFLKVNNKHIIKIHIFKGSAPPYYLKHKGKENGTYIRVGSSNRQASSEIIEELERQHKNISFDSELSHHKEVDWLNIDSFKSLYQEKTGEPLTAQVLKKLDLFKTEQTKILPTNALILLSDDEVRKQLFPYAKIECARFKGTIPGKLLPSVDFNDMEAGQSDIRNKVLAPVFKKMGIIE